MHAPFPRASLLACREPVFLLFPLLRLSRGVAGGRPAARIRILRLLKFFLSLFLVIFPICVLGLFVAVCAQTPEEITRGATHIASRQADAAANANDGPLLLSSFLTHVPRLQDVLLVEVDNFVLEDCNLINYHALVSVRAEMRFRE